MSAKLVITGTYDGFEESKSDAGQYYAYISLEVKPPEGLLRSQVFQRQFGAPLQGSEKLGGVALLTTKDRLPRAIIGDRVQASAMYWPVAVPFWGDRNASLVYGSETRATLLLDGDLKKYDGAPKGISAHINGVYQSAHRIDARTVNAVISVEETPPFGVLRTRAVQKGRAGFIQAEDKIGALHVSAAPAQLPPAPTGTPVTLEATVWPVRELYVNKETGALDWRVMPKLVLFASSAIVAEKVKV